MQGVGFRYRAKIAARANDLTGWVDNLWDGRVEMEVQGELSGIERMIQEIEMGSFIRIENYQMEDLPVDERSGALFEIKGMPGAMGILLLVFFV